MPPTPRRRQPSPAEPSSQPAGEWKGLPALRQFLTPTERLRLDPRNARTHPDEQLDAYAAALERHGQHAPILYREEDGIIVKGAGAYLSARTRLGWTEIAAIPLEDSRLEAAARAISDNRIGDLGGTDTEILGLVVKDLQNNAPELLDAIGYKPNQIEGLLSTTRRGRRGEDDPISAPKGNPATRRGDLYRLGPHRLVCGSPTSAEELQLLMGEDQAHMVYAAPPLAVAGKGHEDAGLGVAHTALERIVLDQAAHDRAAYYLWAPDVHRDDLAKAARGASLEHLDTIVWAKPIPERRGTHYRSAHELALYCVRSGNRPEFHGDRDQATVWRIGLNLEREPIVPLGSGLVVIGPSGSRLYLFPEAPRGRKKLETVHLEDLETVVSVEAGVAAGNLWEVAADGKPAQFTQRPVELARRAIQNSTRPGEIVLDPFAGQGNTILAAQSANRHAYLLEISRGNCDLIVKRWETATGGQAERVRTPRKRRAKK